MRGNAYVVQIRLTREEWRHFSRLAYVRRVTLEELVREGLGLRPKEREHDAIGGPDRNLHLSPPGSAV